MGARILAVVVAVVMVVGSLALRSRWDEDEEQRSQVLRLTCAPELEAECRALEGDPESAVAVTVEPPDATAARLAAAQPGADIGMDGWLTVDDWPRLVDAERQAANLDPLFPEAAILGSSRVGVAVWSGRLPGLDACDRTWACLADVVAPPGGRRARIGLPNPDRTGTGLAALAGVAVSSFAPEDFGRADIEGDAEFQRRLVGLLESSRSVESELELFLAQRGAGADAVIVLEVGLRGASDIPALRETTVIYPAPVTAATVVLGATRSAAGDRLLALLPRLSTTALEDRGWSVPPAEQTNLPDGGVLAALRDAWSAR